MIEEVVKKKVRGKRVSGEQLDIVEKVHDEDTHQLSFKYKGALIYDIIVSYHVFSDSVYIFKIDCVVNRKPYSFLRMAGNIGRRRCKNLFDDAFKKRHKGFDVTYCEDLQVCLKLK